MKRACISLLILCACCVAVAWSQQPAVTCVNNWREFHWTNMVRSNPCELVLNINNVGRLGLKWSNASAGGRSSPAIVNGTVYVGSGDYNVYALNATTGAQLWSYATGNIVWSSPAVANGAVYVGSYDNNVYALNAKTGTKLWSYATGNAVDSSPAVANGMVYVSSEDGTIYAFGLK